MMTQPHTRQWLPFVAALSLLFSFFAASSTPAVMAQESLIPVDAPVDIHEGTCEDLIVEPTFDGGNIVETSLDDVWEDERFQSGILVDEQMGASGFDLNGDSMLGADEIVAPTGENAPIGSAEGDLGGSVDTSVPQVVAVHASPDAYDTILACGVLNNAQEVEGGRQLIQLQPVGESQLFGYAILEENGESMVTYLFQPGEVANLTPAATAAVGVEGYPVELHDGTCQDWTTEPRFDIGTMQETNVAAPEEQEVGDMEGEVPAGAENLGSVYKVDAETEFGANELIEDGGSYVVTVHESAENYTSLVACGQVLPILDGDQVIVILQPVGDSGQTGFVKLGQDAGQAKGLLWNCQPLQPAAPEATPTPMPTQEPTPTPTVAPTQTPTPEPSPTATLAPTSTEEATAVIEETVVIVETEVVPAPTATAAAESTP